MARRVVAPTLLQQFNDLDEAKVLFMLLDYLDEQNRVVVELTKLSHEYEILPSKTRSAIERLVAAGHLAKGPKLGRASSFWVNPKIAWLETDE